MPHLTLQRAVTSSIKEEFNKQAFEMKFEVITYINTKYRKKDGILSSSCLDSDNIIKCIKDIIFNSLGINDKWATFSSGDVQYNAIEKTEVVISKKGR